MSCLYILEIKPLLVTLFANIFSQSVGCLFFLMHEFFKISFLFWGGIVVLQCCVSFYCTVKWSRVPCAIQQVLFFSFFYKFYFIYFIYLLLAELGLCCCPQAFSSCGEQGLLFIAVRRLLIVVASLVAEHGL